MNIFWNIFELAVNIFEAANVMYFVFAFLKGNIHNKKECRNWIIGSLTYATTSTFLNSFINIFFFFSVEPLAIYIKNFTGLIPI